ncbi:MAG: beta-ketoacyl-[acyl-carrier-protein] synthase family protein [Piscinibacter sp.]|nr:beta-ketoacyl-[acyl-carrier-protein] synthase family protein [Piscinibacter sp.]
MTGLGVISSIGTDRQAFARSLREGRCTVAPILSFPTEGYPYAHATEVQDLGVLQDDYDLLTPRLGRASAFAVLAARQAVADAGLDRAALERAQAGVVLGSTNGESQQIDSVVRRAMFDGAQAVPPGDWAGASAGRIAGAVAAELGLPGGGMVLATACAGSNYAIGAALDAIRDGEAEVMLCGGVDAVCRWTYSAFFRIGAVTPDVPRPFDRDRRGLLTGEGAGVLVLESREHALARGARIWAEVLGYATNCDARHMVAPDRDSVARCMRLAQADAGIAPQEVDYVSAHGTGTRANDVTESGAIRDVFGAHAPPVSSIKSMMGHTMGAANVMGALACLVGMDEDFLPPTIGFRTPDPECDIDCVPNQARPAHIRVAQNNGFGFGGNNAIVVLARHAQEACA